MREKGVVALHLPNVPFKKSALGWSRYRDTNSVPTSPLADDIATAPSGPGLVINHERMFIYSCLVAKVNGRHFVQY